MGLFGLFKSKSAQKIHDELIEEFPELIEEPKEEPKEEVKEDPKEEVKEEVKPTPKAYKQDLYDFFLKYEGKYLYYKENGRIICMLISPYTYEMSKNENDTYYEGFNISLYFVRDGERDCFHDIKITSLNDIRIKKDFIDITDEDYEKEVKKEINSYIKKFKNVPLNSIGYRIEYPTIPDRWSPRKDGYTVAYKLTRKIINNNICYAEIITKIVGENKWSDTRTIVKWSSISIYFEKKNIYIDPEFDEE